MVKRRDYVIPMQVMIKFEQFMGTGNDIGAEESRILSEGMKKNSTLTELNVWRWILIKCS